jgi:hypothetical protein
VLRTLLCGVLEFQAFVCAYPSVLGRFERDRNGTGTAGRDRTAASVAGLDERRRNADVGDRNRRRAGFVGKRDGLRRTGKANDYLSKVESLIG